MKKKLIFLFLNIFFIVTSLYSADEIKWESNLSAVLKNAEKQNALIMIFVYTESCDWCKELDKRTYTHKRVIEVSKKFICTRINPEKDSKDKIDFVKQFGYSGYPTILFVDNKGKLYGMIEGFLDGDAYVKEMEDVIKVEKKIHELMKKHEKGDRKSTNKLIDIFYQRELYHEAAELILVLKEEEALPEDPVYYFILGSHYFDSKQYKDAYANFIYIIEDMDVPVEIYYHAAYMAGYCLYFTDGKKKSISFLKKYRDNEKNPYTSIFVKLIQYLESN
jgi:thioredoxin-related protein